MASVPTAMSPSRWPISCRHGKEVRPGSTDVMGTSGVASVGFRTSPSEDNQPTLTLREVAIHHENRLASQPVALPVMGNLVEREGGEFS